MFGYKLVKEEKTENKEKTFTVKGALKTVGKTVGVGLAVGGAFLAGKEFDKLGFGKEDKTEELEDDQPVGTDD